jgi:hypothetical protein
MIEHDEQWKGINSSGVPGLMSSWLEGSLVFTDQELVKDDQFLEEKN